MTSDARQSDLAIPVFPEIPNRLCLLILAAAALASLGKVLFSSSHEVLSDGRMDLSFFFVPWREFGFRELRAGNLPLWNPHIYCGAPFFGNFQSALLYPLNFLYLIFPLDAAINWTIALHLFLGGAFTFYWVRYRGLHSLACLMSGLLFMFCGPHFLQIRAGHLPNLCTLIWAPPLFLAIDRLVDAPSLGPCLFGMFAMAMAVLAGHPQYVFYMGVAAGIYSALNLARARQRGKVILGLAAIVGGGIALCAVQLFTGLNESSESMRSPGISFEFASGFSFGPENFLTMVAPWCFGDAKNIAYVGRGFVTESSLFIGAAALALAMFGMTRETWAIRRYSITMLVVTLVLAMGCYTPLFHFLYYHVPGFNLFRGMDKFLLLSALFLAMLAGAGLDQMLRWRKVTWLSIAAVGGVAVLFFSLAIVLHDVRLWKSILQIFQPDNMPFRPLTLYLGPNIIERSCDQCARNLVLGAGCLLLVAGLFALAKFRRELGCAGLIFSSVLELASFAESSLMTFQIAPAYPPKITAFLAQHPGDYRVKGENPNAAMMAGTLDIAGADPSGLLRYVRYGWFTTGLDYDRDNNGDYLPESPNPSAWRMLSCRYVLTESQDKCTPVEGALPWLSLIDRFRVMTNYHEIFSTLTNSSFHIDQEVILESRPDPLPVPASDKGTVKTLHVSTDSATIEADTKTPCLLLMTDSYSRFWRAQALPGSSQQTYHILPANYCLRAIPLAAGHHVFRVEYSPPGYRIGKAVSIPAWGLFIVLTGWVLAQKSQWRRSPSTDTGPRASL